MLDGYILMAIVMATSCVLVVFYPYAVQNVWSIYLLHVLLSLQVLQFVVAHTDVFLAILRDRQQNVTVESLQELALATAIVGRTAYTGQCWQLSSAGLNLYVCGNLIGISVR